MKSDIDFNVIIPVAEADLQQLIVGLDYIFENLQPRKIIIIANNNLKDFLPLSSRVEFLDEDNVFEKLTLHNIEQILEYLVGNQKRSGWYFQQFLKMAYAYICEDAYYLIWDADTVPLNKIEFRNDGKYYFTMKTEYHKPYFDTLEKLFSGEVKKHNQMSFISEQMIIDKKIMIEVIEKIKHNKNIKGKLFFEKILYSIDINEIVYSGFSEFETYGNYTMKYYPEYYKLRYLKTFRNGAQYFNHKLTKKEAIWISKDYDTISFETWDKTKALCVFINKVFLKIKIVPFRYTVTLVSKIDALRNFSKKIMRGCFV